MKMNIKKSLQGLLFVPVLAFAASVVMPVVQPVAVYAQTDKNCVDPSNATNLSLSNGIDCAKSKDQPDSLFASNGIFRTIVNTILFIIGAVSVIMIIFGGFRYVTSGGDSGGVTSAKNTILYAVIGLVVALLAYAIIQFVLGSLTT